jgi:putative transposase
MIDIYCQIYVHLILAFQENFKLLQTNEREEVLKTLTQIINGYKQSVIEANCMFDHVHVLLEIDPDITLASLVEEVQKKAAEFVNGKKWYSSKFGWQPGFGAFTFSGSELDKVILYVQNQDKTHEMKSLQEEYTDWLNMMKTNSRGRDALGWSDEIDPFFLAK